MSLSDYDMKRIRLVLDNGEFFEGRGEHLSPEYCLHELGREKEALQIGSEDEDALIDNWVFYEEDILRIDCLEEDGEKPPRLLYYAAPEEFSTTAWAGGTTTQLFIYPWQGDYARRSFLWRVSSAQVELPQSDFTPLPDYQRFITPLEGRMTLSIDGGEEICLHPLDVLSFDGGSETRSQGICRDFNLMLRKEKTAGGMDAYRLSQDKITINVPAEARHFWLYCPAGSCRIQTPFSQLILTPDQPLLVVENPGNLILSACSADANALVTAWAIKI